MTNRTPKLFNIKLGKLVKEIYSYKRTKINGKKSTGGLEWEAIQETGPKAGMPLLPVAFDFDVTFRVKLNTQAIESQYTTMDQNFKKKILDKETWFVDAKSWLSERSVLYSARTLAPKGYSLKFVTYAQSLSEESDMVRLLDPKKTAPIKYGFTFHFEEITKSPEDLNIKVKLGEIVSAMTIFLGKFENLILKDNKYYKITK